ncbi:MAG: cupredoxin domain-containing protein [Pseudomonadales bacterium]|nr:cupredoxin domain-containing protein [Pseudomonadales bacterium]
MRRLAAMAMLAVAVQVGAAEPAEVKLVIKDHKFVPAEVRIPAATKVMLVIENQDPTPEEFESHDLHREKVIAGNRTAKIPVGPLKPGSYKFFGEFNQDTAQGVLIAE